MRDDLYDNFLRSLKKATSMVRGKRLSHTSTVHRTLCAACGKLTQCTAYSDVGFVCLSCSQKKN